MTWLEHLNESRGRYPSNSSSKSRFMTPSSIPGKNHKRGELEEMEAISYDKEFEGGKKIMTNHKKIKCPATLDLSET